MSEPAPVKPPTEPPPPSELIAVVNWGNRVQLNNGTILQYESVDARSTDSWVILVNDVPRAVTLSPSYPPLVPYVVIAAASISAVWQG
jgi:hypothetical protein